MEEGPRTGYCELCDVPTANVKVEAVKARALARSIVTGPRRAVSTGTRIGTRAGTRLANTSRGLPDGRTTEWPLISAAISPVFRRGGVDRKRGCGGSPLLLS